VEGSRLHGPGTRPLAAGRGEAMSSAGGADASSRILVEEDGEGIVTITINRPEALNALTRPMMQARRQAVGGGHIKALHCSGLHSGDMVAPSLRGLALIRWG